MHSSRTRTLAASVTLLVDAAAAARQSVLGTLHGTSGDEQGAALELVP